MQPVNQGLKRLLSIAAVVGTTAVTFTMWVLVSSAGVLAHEETRLSACSPDGVYCASLALRSNSGLSSDVYYLRLKDTGQLGAWSHWADFGKGEQILTTTEVGPSRLVWKDDRHLEVICDACKMTYGDVIKQKQTVGPVLISYIGFVPVVH